ncbi:BED-type domain-containing protein [Citrus sinensis]|uniref:BED-type domain-containing protein n=1 Tax=Citrus sinensis TaxID=2711 RepID=A0ACB8N8K0_CITSI|nr:BED-type domain-containing protein [Citrus sinensis]
MARAIVMHEYPLSIVKHQGLRDVMSSLNQLWKPVSRNTIKNEILDMYECERAKYISVLEQTQVSGSHTGQVLCDKLMGSLLELNIERKLSSIIVDNAATNDRMIDFMLLALDKNDLILGGQKFHVRCCAHILNLIVKDSLSVIGDLIANIRESVIFWSKSTKRKSTFDENARKLGITSGRKLVQDCPTRWDSTYLMICSALHYKNVFCRLNNIDGQYKCLPSEHDLQLASALENDLKCFYDCTTLFSSSSYPTSNLFLRHIVYGDCQSIVKEYKARYASAASSPGYSSSSLSTSHSMPSSGSYKGSTEWILGFTSFVNVGNEEVKDELDTYLGEKLVPFNVVEEFDVLAWSKVNGGNYPILSQIARDILAILVTIVVSESAFSTGGRFVSPYRNRLHPSTLEALMYSQSWIRALCGVVASTSPAYAKILDEEPEIETNVEAIEVYENLRMCINGDRYKLALCDLGQSGNSSICNQTYCSVCGIIKSGFSPKLDGISTLSSRWRAHVAIPEEIEEEFKFMNLKRAMLVCRVVAGRVGCDADDDVDMAKENGGFDSVVGRGAGGVNSRVDDDEELLVFNPKAVLPCFVIVYTV